ncbi:MAG: zinc-finger domain-containing protein [Gammaproteobacteria bacterium]|nr:zinc-finger domain-containing protein [Gammaproteobacteria bacterium]MCI0590237.1 zinc-finger domain-containing protein [Gammaproteobacteria bacterium]
MLSGLANSSDGKGVPNDKRLYEVTSQDLPLHCPLPCMSLWNSHPRVYLPIEATGRAKCPYCGADFVLKTEEESS